MKLVFAAAALIALTTDCLAAGGTSIEYRASGHIEEPYSFNGIEVRASFALVPPDIERPLSDMQLNAVSEYHDLEDLCRGGRPSPEQELACTKRDNFDLKALGVCFGRKSDKSISDMKWHACRPSSNEYKAGSERIDVTCRPGKELNFTLRLVNAFDFEDTTVGQQLIKIGTKEFAAKYVFSKSSENKNYPTTLSYYLEGRGAETLLEAYDNHKIIFAVNDSASVSVRYGGRSNIEDLIANLYAGCK